MKNRSITIIPIDDTVLLPGFIYPLHITEKKLINSLEELSLQKEKLGFFAKHPKQPKKGIEIFEVGILGEIIRFQHLKDESVEIYIRGLKRIKIEKISQKDPLLQAEAKPLRTRIVDKVTIQGLSRALKDLFESVYPLEENYNEEILKLVRLEKNPEKSTFIIAANIESDLLSKQRILEENNLEKRIKKVIELLNIEKKILNIEEEIQQIVDTEIDKTQKEILLREQLRAIKKQLGEDEEDFWDKELRKLKEEILAKKMPEEAEKTALKEVDRLYDMALGSPEYTVSRTYIDWLLSLPWNEETEDNLNIKKAEKVLNEDHYNLKDVKERILEFLSVRKLKKDTKGPILCFVGPPGVGKTSLGKSIARALGRKFVRFSVGGIRDEAEIRGHRRTYVGAMPGRIIQLLKDAGSRNPVLMLDEIDKLGSDSLHGDPSSALLEALDPEQNYSFMDHYLDVKFDLSNVMFILTANVTYSIPDPLYDRLEVIEIPGYITDDKIKIASKYLIPRQLAENGIENLNIRFPISTIRHIITDYTDEAGLRELERKIATICRKIARKVAEGVELDSDTVSQADLHKYLGPPKEYELKALKKNETGIVHGLAWTQTGGDLLLVEALIMSGGKQLILTGQLGEVMQESAQAALSYIRSHAHELNIPEDFYNHVDIHLHLPEGAIPKDGPSAGITLITAMVSVITEIPVKHSVAMTGEISLRGRVIPVGAIKEKVVAAHRAGIKTVIIPKANIPDLSEVPDRIRKKIDFIPVETVDEVLKIALEKNPFLAKSHPNQTRLKKIIQQQEQDENQNNDQDD
ncbi:MAG: endopeptidase La [Calditrichia bacterium]